MEASRYSRFRLILLVRHRLHQMIDIKGSFFFFFFSCILFSPFLSLQILPFVIEIVRVLPLVTFPLVYFLKGERADDEIWVAIGVLLFFILLGVLTIFSVLRTGHENPGSLERLTRYGMASLSLSKRVEVRKYSVR